MNTRITKKLVRLGDIDFRLPKDIDLEREFNGDDTHLKIYESILTYGWQPDFYELPYHGEIANANPFILMELPDGKYELIANALHRALVLKYKFNPDEKFEFFVREEYDEDYFDLEEIKRWINENERLSDLGGRGRYQTIYFPFNLQFEGRDNSFKMFQSTRLPQYFYCGKSVLDIACNFGVWCHLAKINGASEGCRLDINDWFIQKARESANLLKLDIEFNNCSFWDWDWNRKFDIVFVTQSIYHFGFGVEETNKVLDNICNSANDMLILYTFVYENHRTNYLPDMRDGYRPTIEKIVNDLHARGFKNIEIFEGESGKRTVVANKNPRRYNWSHENEENVLYSDGLLIENFWDNLDNQELYPKTFGINFLENIKECRIGDREIEYLFRCYEPEQNKEEYIEAIQETIKINPKNILEIGVKHGDNLEILDTIHKKGKTIGIDIDFDRLQYGFNNSKNQIHFISGDSHDERTVERLEDILKCEPLDCLFIDNKQDYELYSPFVRENGLIVFRDILFFDEIENVKEKRKVRSIGLIWK